MKHKDMTAKEAGQHYKKDIWKKMLESGLLTGITGRLNKNGELVIYAHDLENAYNYVKTGKIGFID